MSKVRFCNNNFLDISSASITYSSQSTNALASNLGKEERYKTWSPTGQFLIDSTNENFYINDGSDKTVTLTNASYLTGTLLAYEITTQLNISSSGWTCTYDASTYMFNVTRSSSGTVRYATTTNAVWDTIGHTSVSNSTGTSFPGDEIRIHTDEWIVWDLGSAATPTFFALISTINEAFPLSANSTIRIQGNSSDSWSSPSYSQTLTISDFGIFYYLVGTNNYRYWRLHIEDRENTGGPSFVLSQCYLGDYFTLTSRNISSGFDRSITDFSRKNMSINGTIYGVVRPRAVSFSSLQIQFIDGTDYDNLENLCINNSYIKPFYLSLDPDLVVSDNYYELTKYVFFDDQPTFTHVVTDIYTMNFDVTEAI